MLTRSKDRKVTNLVSPNGKSAVLANAFGLPAGKSYACPGATSFCERICYAGKLEKIYSGVKNVLVSNFEQLLYADYLDGIDGMCYLLSAMVKEFVSDCERRNAPLKFRIHWDGDFFSRDYATAWSEVVRYFPNVQFWVYTRSFDVVDIISGIDNLTVYLSADVENFESANDTASAYGVRMATVADTFADAKQLMAYQTDKSYPCPENGKRIPLIDVKGSACVRCGICVEGRGDVLFSVKKR